MKLYQYFCAKISCKTLIFTKCYPKIYNMPLKANQSLDFCHSQSYKTKHTVTQIHILFQSDIETHISRTFLDVSRLGKYLFCNKIGNSFMAPLKHTT
jgi:hypothetical protein